MAKGKIAVGAILGALVGIAAGVLAAPKSGKETRRGLKTKAAHLKRTTADSVETAKERIGERVEKAVSHKDKE